MEYTVYNYEDKLIPGEKMTISHSVYPKQEEFHIPIILSSSTKEEIEMAVGYGEQMEKHLFEKLKKAMKEWEEQAAMTAINKQALEFFNIKPVKHTNNEWKDVFGEGYVFERSNAVYKFVYRPYEHTRYVHELGKMIPVSYSLNWTLYIHAPYISEVADINKIAGQEKKFKTKEEMEKYLNGRIKAYDHLFQEEYPVVPKEYAEMFMFHGMVKPGYRIAEE